MVTAMLALAGCTTVHNSGTSGSTSPSIATPSAGSTTPSSSSVASHPGLLPKGSVSGVLRWSDSGPLATAGKPLTRGTVTFHGSVVRTVSVNRHGHFSLSLPIGSYRVTGASPDYHNAKGGCSTSGAVVVKAGQSQAVQVVCAVD
jgi:hypothetical protein